MTICHVKPVEGMRFGGSFYYDHLDNNGYGSHSGHTVSPNVAPGKMNTGPLDYSLLSGSFAYFGKRAEFLQELTYNISKTDSTGTANNLSFFSYMAYRLSDKHVVYGLYDGISVDDNDIHVYPLDRDKMALGYRLEVSPNLNLKMQLESFRDHKSMSSVTHSMHSGHDIIEKLSFRIQIAYGF